MSIFSFLIALVSFNPIFLSLMLILMSLFTGISLAIVFSKWLILAILLIFLGGIIIIFIYVTALAGRQKFFYPQNSFLYLLAATALSAQAVHSPAPSLSLTNIQEIFHFSFTSIILFILVLLVTLFIRVKLVESFKGALKFFI